ncbi:MAG: hypothetical protein ACT6FF_04385, partial [Methanosarcinaceae archaeon]
GDDRLKYQVQDLCYAYILHNAHLMQGEISICNIKKIRLETKRELLTNRHVFGLNNGSTYKPLI